MHRAGDKQEHEMKRAFCSTSFQPVPSRQKKMHGLKTRATAIGLAIFFVSTTLARESWPAASEDTKKRLAEEKIYEEAVWKKIEPEVMEWAKKGKPYIPWAAKPEDLPQAEIPAFPGAQGGGKFSFGGRGGKVFVV